MEVSYQHIHPIEPQEQTLESSMPIQSRMRGRCWGWLTILILQFCSLWGKASGDSDNPLSIGIYSTQKPSEVARQFHAFTKAFEAALRRQSGTPITIHLAVMRTYADGLRFLRDGEVDILELGAAAYVTAKDELPDLQLLAVRNPEDPTLLAGVICTQSNSPIAKLPDLRDKAFAFGDKLSTTGHFLAQEQMFRNGLRSKDLRRFAFLGSHEQVADAVANGEFDAGAFNEITYRAKTKAGASLKVLTRFRNQGRPWVARGTLSTELKEAAKAALLQMNGSPTLTAFGEDGVAIQNITEADFDPLRWAIHDSDRFFK